MVKTGTLSHLTRLAPSLVTDYKKSDGGKVEYLLFDTQRGSFIDAHGEAQQCSQSLRFAVERRSYPEPM